MRTVLRAAWVVLLVGACTPSDPFPQDPDRRRASLSESVLSEAASLARRPERAEDAGLAVAQVVLTGQAPRLRLMVSGDDPALAAGASVALVRILRQREDDPRAALLECSKSESNDFVRARCAAELETVAPSDSIDAIEPLLESKDASRRLEGLRRLLALRAPFEKASPRVDSALLHLVRAEDPAVRLLAKAAMLRRALPPLAP